VIKPVKRKLRDGWFVQTLPSSDAVAARALAEAQDWSDVRTVDDSEWVW